MDCWPFEWSGLVVGLVVGGFGGVAVLGLVGHLVEWRRREARF